MQQILKFVLIQLSIFHKLLFRLDFQKGWCAIIRRCIFIFIPLFTFGCQEEKQDVSRNIENISDSHRDTLIGFQNITDEIAGSTLRKRATAYFLIIDRDTSAFRPIFTEGQDGSVSLLLHAFGLDKKMAYQERMNELIKILPIASKEYNFKFLRNISLARFVQTGDLAIKVTEEYLRNYNNITKITTRDYKRIAAFLAKSQLAIDFNKIFIPYALVVKDVSIEKVFFTTSQELYQFSSIRENSAKIPDKILDCLTVVKMGNR